MHKTLKKIIISIFIILSILILRNKCYGFIGGGDIDSDKFQGLDITNFLFNHGAKELATLALKNLQLNHISHKKLGTFVFEKNTHEMLVKWYNVDHALKFDTDTGLITGLVDNATFIAQCMQKGGAYKNSEISTQDKIDQSINKVKEKWKQEYKTSTFQVDPIILLLPTDKERSKIYLAAAIDIILKGKQDSWRNEIGDLKTITLEEITNKLTTKQKDIIYSIFALENWYPHASVEVAGKKVGLSNYIKQMAIWKLLNQIDDEMGHDEGELLTKEAAKAYGLVLNQASEYFKNDWTDGTMKKDDINLKVRDDKAEVNINNVNSDNPKYVVGPFYVYYDFYQVSLIEDKLTTKLNSANDVPGNEKVDYRFSWVKSYKFTDQDGNEIKNVRIIDADGNAYKTIPRSSDSILSEATGINKVPFYLEFSYNDYKKITEVKIDVEVEWFLALEHANEIHYYDQKKEIWKITNYLNVKGYQIPVPSIQSKDGKVKVEDSILIKGGIIAILAVGDFFTGGALTEVLEEAAKKDFYIASTTYNIYPYYAIMDTSKTTDNGRVYQPLINETTGTKMQTKTATKQLHCYIDTGEMEIAGYVWDDSLTQGKDQEINGSRDDDEKAIPGVVVTLYEVDPEDGKEKLATLASGHVRDFKSDKAVLGSKVISTNPTITDDNGYYSFKGVDASKKYYVKYTYNGVDYEATTKKYEYDGASTAKEIINTKYNTGEWNRASKGAETTEERNKLNNKFVTIQSTPKNYYETEAIFWERKDSYLVKEDNENQYYNKVYVAEDVKDLKNEIYEKAIERLALKATVEAIINKNFNNSSNSWEEIFDGTDSYMKSVYRAVASKHGYDSEIMCKLQFIYDSKIDAYSGYTNEEGGSVCGYNSDGGKISKKRNYNKSGNSDMELYPIYKKFKLTKNIDPKLSEIKDIGESALGQLGFVGEYMENQLSQGKIEYTDGGYYYIYVGQLNIGMGLIPRATTTLNLREDLVETVVSINGKDEKYKYGTLSDKELELSASDYFVKSLSSALVSGGYNQTITPEDYNYSTSQEKLRNGTATYEENYAKIQIYAKYKIMVKNLSLIPTSVNELVTYFNRTYLSYSDIYVTTQNQTLAGISGKKGDNAITDIKTTSNSRYGKKSETGLGTYADLYINLGEKGVMLETNETMTVYVTYRMGEISTKDPIKYSCIFGLDNSAQNILKQTLGKGQKINIETVTEINGFSTYYKLLSIQGLSESEIAKRAKMLTVGAYKYTYKDKNGNDVQYRAAGVMDTYSVPGNLKLEDLLQVVPKEKDWDKAPTLIFGNSDRNRTLSGTVWETTEFAIEYLKDVNKYPILDNSVDQNHKIKDITVELIEIKKDNTQVVRATTTTNEQGNYTFTGYVPGNYVVRFIYGDKILYSKNQSDTMNYGTYNYPYSGEFYQSAKANPNTNNGGVLGNTRFWYEDNKNTRYSDAYDEANIREEVNTKFSNSAKNGYVYSDAVDAIKNPRDYTMYAYTALMEFYPEYAKYDTVAQDPSYSVENIDFALTPRTKTHLNITKEVSSIRLVLQNGTVKFDATPQTIREQGVPGVVQAGRGNTINISLSNELLNGATIEITYQITVKNDSEYNSVTYYKNSAGKNIALGLYEESYDKLVAFEKNYTEMLPVANTIINKTRNKIRTYTKAEEDFITNTDTKNKVSVIEAGSTGLEEYKSREVVVTTTTPTMIADLVSNNLNFAHTDATGRVINNGWEVYEGTAESFISSYYVQKADQQSIEPTIIGNIDTTEVYNVNTIVIATNDNPLITKKLQDGEESTAYITLSKIISTENDLSDTKSYTNSIRIVQVNNTVSRIQDMNSNDSTIRLKDTTSPVVITDPTGEDRSYLAITITLISISILAVGIVLIKKFILK